MKNKEEIAISKKTWFTWGLVTALGIAMLLVYLNFYNYRPLCSPVVGCGYEIPLGLTLFLSAAQLLIRVFKKNKLKLITPFILLVFSALLMFLITSVENRFNASMESLALSIQNLCTKDSQCPETLPSVFDNVRLIKADTIITLETTEDEIMENPASIIAAGYVASNEDSGATYRYKLKPYYGFVFFDYKASGETFTIDWVAGEAKILRARITKDSNSKLLYEKYCNPDGETCYNTGTSYL